MKKHTSVDVLIVGGSYGHRSLADAAMYWLNQEGISTQLLLPSESKMTIYYVFNKWYQMIYRLFSNTYGLFFWLGKTRLGYWIFTSIFRLLNQNMLESALVKSKPKLVISTFFYYNSTLAALCTQNATPLLNIISDPRSLHPVVAMDAPGLNLCFDQNNQDRLKQIFPQATSVISGWFVRPIYEATYSQPKIRKMLGIDPDRLVVLITAGSEGTYQSIVTLVGFLVQHRVRCHTIVACGNSGSLYRVMKKMSGGSNPKIEALRFTKNLHQYMQAADVVVGKAGPNTIFESVATLTPFLATTYIEGQETGNLDLIQEYQVGEVELKSSMAARRIKQWAENPNLLNQYQPGLRKLRTHNMQARKVLVREVKRYLKP